jgi:hypothetical protein
MSFCRFRPFSGKGGKFAIARMGHRDVESEIHQNWINVPIFFPSRTVRTALSLWDG